MINSAFIKVSMLAVLSFAVVGCGKVGVEMGMHSESVVPGCETVETFESIRLNRYQRFSVFPSSELNELKERGVNAIVDLELRLRTKSRSYYRGTPVVVECSKA